MKSKMPVKIRAYVIIGVALFVLFSCKKGGNSVSPNGTGSKSEEKVTLPSIEIAVTGSFEYDYLSYVIGHDSIMSGGSVSNDGGAPVTSRGVCWSTSQNPTIADNKTNDGVGTGKFISPIGGLTVNTKYYLRAYATNSKGTNYSNRSLSFTTAFRVGEYYQGGYVFFIDETTVHGLIATQHLFSETAWGVGAASAYSASDGKANTDKIIKKFGENTKTAAGMCKACRDGGYDDWFLPAINQLSVLLNASGVPGGAFASGNGPWSSTEDRSNSSLAYIYVGSFGTSLAEPKSVKHLVRPIRAF
jgi:hypothetical protein